MEWVVKPTKGGQAGVPRFVVEPVSVQAGRVIIRSPTKKPSHGKDVYAAHHQRHRRTEYSCMANKVPSPGRNVGLNKENPRMYRS